MGDQKGESQLRGATFEGGGSIEGLRLMRLEKGGPVTVVNGLLWDGRSKGRGGSEIWRTLRGEQKETCLNLAGYKTAIKKKGCENPGVTGGEKGNDGERVGKDGGV